MTKTQITYRFERQPITDLTEGVQENGKVIARRLDKIIPMREGDNETCEFLKPALFEELPPSLESSKSSNDFSSTWSEFPTDFGAWQSPFDMETEQLEKLIRESNETPPKQFEMPHPAWSSHRDTDVQSYDDFDTQDARTHSFNMKNSSTHSVSGPDVYPDLRASSYLRHSKKPWGKMITAVSGAIITGVVFGFFVLSLFTTGDNELNADLNNLLPNNQAAIGTDIPGEVVGLDKVVESDSSKVSSAQENIMAINIPSKSFFVLQNGMFSTLEASENAQQLLASKGFAAVSERLDNYFVYAGISANRDDALLMSHQLHQHDFETYIKMITLPTIRAVHWQGESVESLEDYFIQGNQLVELIGSLTVMQLQQATPTAIEPTFMKSITEAHQAWSGLSSLVYEGMPDDHKSKLQKVNIALNTTIISLEAYKKNPSFSYLWQAQSALIDYVVLQKQLLESMEVK